VIAKDIQIPTPDGTADGLLLGPDGSDGSSPPPRVIHLTDIMGIRPAHRDMAARLAAEGYTVLVPNVFYRTARPPLFAFPFVFGEERTMQRIGELARPLTPEAIERDASAYIDFIGGGPVAIVGHCFSGQMALRCAAARPDAVVAVASFHGGNLVTDAPTSPHHVLPRVKARLYFGHASQDRSMPQPAIDTLEAALRAWGGRFESERYDGALHGWTVPGSPVYNQPQAERAFAKLRELLAAELR
jgi:carboxymethylenebutenolidase